MQILELQSLAGAEATHAQAGPTTVSTTITVTTITTITTFDGNPELPAND